MITFCLSRKTGNQRGSQGNIRYRPTQLSNDCFQLTSRSSAAHPLKDSVAAMLNRHIQIMTYFRFCPYNLDQFVCNLLRITVKQSNPLDSLHLTQFLQKHMQPLFSVNILAPGRRFLGDNIYLLHAGSRQISCILQHIIHRHTAVIAPKLRNNTIGTMFITALTDFKVAAVTPGGQHAARLNKRKPVRRFKGLNPLAFKTFIDDLAYGIVGRRSHHRVDLRQLFKNFIPIFFRQTAGHDEQTANTIFL